MSEGRKLGNCSRCGKEIAPYEKFNELLNFEKYYCEECYNYYHEEILCEKCNRKLMRQDEAEHFIEYHSEI
jgi:hypothetical protein